MSSRRRAPRAVPRGRARPAGSSVLSSRTTLSNGLRVLLAPLPHAHSAAVAVHLRSGPRYDPPSLSGLSHFLEHMLHRGVTRHPSAHALALAFEELGGELEASTYADHMVLSSTSPPENLPAILSLFAEVCQSPVFRDLELERGIVKEEILEFLNGRGRLVDADDLVLGLCFGDHGLGRPITGTLSTLQRFTKKALRQLHGAQFRAGALVVTVAGAFDPALVRETLRVRFADLPAGGPAPDCAPPAPSGPGFSYVSHSKSQTALRLGFRAPHEAHELEPATELLVRLLDDGMATRLYQKVCDERGLAYDVSATYEAFSDAGLLLLAAECAHARAPALLDTLLTVAQKLCDPGPTEGELRRAKRRFAWQMQGLLDAPLGLAEFLGLGELTGVARTPEQRIEQLGQVSAAAVRRAARTVFAPGALSAVAVGRLAAPDRARIQKRILALG